MHSSAKRGYMKLYEAIRGYKRLYEIVRSCTWLYDIIRSYTRLYEAIYTWLCIIIGPWLHKRGQTLKATEPM